MKSDLINLSLGDTELPQGSRVITTKSPDLDMEDSNEESEAEFDMEGVLEMSNTRQCFRHPVVTHRK